MKELTEKQVVQRKIFLKRQYVTLLKEEIAKAKTDIAKMRLSIVGMK